MGSVLTPPTHLNGKFCYFFFESFPNVTGCDSPSHRSSYKGFVHIKTFFENKNWTKNFGLGEASKVKSEKILE